MWKVVDEVEEFFEDGSLRHVRTVIECSDCGFTIDDEECTGACECDIPDDDFIHLNGQRVGYRIGVADNPEDGYLGVTDARELVWPKERF